MKIIYAAFVNTMPSLFNVGGLLFLIMYIFAVIGISIFADKIVLTPMTDRLNFQNIFYSFLTLILVSTGEVWRELMDVLATGKNMYSECIEDATYEDYIKAGKPVACGSPVWSYTFFFLFLSLVTLTFLNLFIAIILAGYFEARDMEKKTLNRQILDNYQESWSQFDPDAIGVIPFSKFTELMFSISKPLGWDESFKSKPKKQRTFIEMFSEKAGQTDNIIFSETLDELALIYVINQEVEKQTEGMEIKSSESESDQDSNKNPLERQNCRRSARMDIKKNLEQAEVQGKAKIV